MTKVRAGLGLKTPSRLSACAARARDREAVGSATGEVAGLLLKTLN